MPLETSCFTYKDLVLHQENVCRVFGNGVCEIVSDISPLICSSPRPTTKELNAAALTIQKFYKSYRTRRNLADCAVVVEELWWKALDFATLKRSSVSFFCNNKPESAVSRWGRARTRVAKVGKGLSKDKNAQKLAICHWLEAIDPRHRYGHNLQLYYKLWFTSQSSQPFFYWLDVGDGKEITVDTCPRNVLHYQCIKYLGPKEREEYQVIIENGKFLYKQNGRLVNTIEGTKWIFVLSTSRTLYVGQKEKGRFQHSSFLAGAATTASGRMVAHDGVLKAIWPYSGHYRPTEETFKEFICFLEEHGVDLSNVKKCPQDDDDPVLHRTKKSMSSLIPGKASTKLQHPNKNANAHCEKTGLQEQRHAKSPRWTSGTGPRIGCVREYPTNLQFQALEQVNLSPRKVNSLMFSTNCPIPSPRPSPRVHLSPRLVNMS
ncbi:hypothetical protein LXL04_008262 [Taraxacum kok-saghyz]